MHPIQQQPTIREMFHHTHDKTLVLNGNLAKMLALDLFPFQFVEFLGLRQITHCVEPHWTIPNRLYFSNKALPELYSKVVASVVEVLAHHYCPLDVC
ncbi:hypothetical protein FKM82_011998 [Ascaphus truei]